MSEYRAGVKTIVVRLELIGQYLLGQYLLVSSFQAL